LSCAGERGEPRRKPFEHSFEAIVLEPDGECLKITVKGDDPRITNFGFLPPQVGPTPRAVSDCDERTAAIVNSASELSGVLRMDD